MSLYVVPDIHGYLSELDRVLALIEADGGQDARILFLGDYVDRGPDSRGVLQRLIDGQKSGRNWAFVRGNHDRMFTGYVRGGHVLDPMIKSKINWFNDRVGGVQSLQSYMGDAVELSLQTEVFESLGVDPRFTREHEALLHAARDAIPESHLRFVEDMPLYIEEARMVFVHAGLRPGVALVDQIEDDLVWIREGWLDNTQDHGQLVVHGHTTIDHPTHHGNRINLDAGAGYGRPLHVAVFEGGHSYLLNDQGRDLLWPHTTRLVAE